jgi:hypothetical protein
MTLLPQTVEFRSPEVFLLGNMLSLEIVGLEDISLYVAFEYKSQFPGQVVRDIHVLASFGEMRVAYVAEEVDVSAISEGLDRLRAL